MAWAFPSEHTHKTTHMQPEEKCGQSLGLDWERESGIWQKTKESRSWKPKSIHHFYDGGCELRVCAWFIKQASVWDKRRSQRYYCILLPSQKFIPPSLSPPSDAAVSTFPKYSVGSRESGWEACNICSQTTKEKKAGRVTYWNKWRRKNPTDRIRLRTSL